MAKVTIYGASDDLLELDGDISEEFDVGCEKPGTTLVFSEGTVLKLKYDNEGCWRLTRKENGKAKFSHESALGPDADTRSSGQPGYSDVVTLEGDIEWVRVRGKTIKTKK